MALGMIAIITLINLVLQRVVDPSSLVYIYLIATSVSALLFGDVAINIYFDYEPFNL